MDDKQKEEVKEIVHIAIQEFMENLYGGIGKSIVNKVLWAGLGAIIFFVVGHYK